MAEPKDSSNFFKKVVKFVSSPNSDWGELNSPPTSISESDFAKSELKAMIERKRHNDFVRKREFDMLRKVRREGLQEDQRLALEGFSRIDEAEDRYDTNIKHQEVKAKIDQIEQQMVGTGFSGTQSRSSTLQSNLTQPGSFDKTNHSRNQLAAAPRASAATSNPIAITATKPTPEETNLGLPYNKYASTIKLTIDSPLVSNFDDALQQAKPLASQSEKMAEPFNKANSPPPSPTALSATPSHPTLPASQESKLANSEHKANQALQNPALAFELDKNSSKPAASPNPQNPSATSADAQELIALTFHTGNNQDSAPEQAPSGRDPRERIQGPESSNARGSASISSSASTNSLQTAPKSDAVLMQEAIAFYIKNWGSEQGVIECDHLLDQAVVAFANADFAFCERSLLNLVTREGIRVHDTKTWLTLFDLYRAIGESRKFEALALEYAKQFALSSPQWFSMPQMMQEANNKQAIVDDLRNDIIDPNQMGWVCPQRLDQEEVAKLQSLTLQMPEPWILDWSNLGEIEIQACAPLATLMRAWADQKLSMNWLSGNQLFKILAEATATGSRDVDPIFWKLRFIVLRIANLVDQFDEAAIDYCVTYEVSPPSCEPTRCLVQVLGSAQTTTAHPLSTISDVSTSFVESRPFEDIELVEVANLELSGQLVGNISATLLQLDARLHNMPIVTLSCSKLIRIDFIAATDLLNWVVRKKTEQRMVFFDEVHRLNAQLLCAMGIHEHAKIRLRVA